MIYKDEKLHIKYVVNIVFDGASPWNYLQTTEMGSLMYSRELLLHSVVFASFAGSGFPNVLRFIHLSTSVGVIALNSRFVYALFL